MNNVTVTSAPPPEFQPPLFDPANWYWFVGSDTTQVYSSAVVGYVPVNNATYQTWLGQPRHRTYTVANEQELWDVLIPQEVPIPSGASSSDNIKDPAFDHIQMIVQRWAFDLDNRVRVLEALPKRTAAQFKSYVKSLLP